MLSEHLVVYVSHDVPYQNHAGSKVTVNYEYKCHIKVYLFQIFYVILPYRIAKVKLLVVREQLLSSYLLAIS